MATNDFLPFATGGSANVLTQAQWAALGALLNGFQSGIADSKSINKAFRQSSIMSAVLAQFIVNQTGQNATDDGTTATLLTNLTSATKGRLLRTSVYTLVGGVQMVSVNGGAFSATGASTWTPLSQTSTYQVTGSGSGGGGGGAVAVSAGQTCAASAGGAGAYAVGVYNTLTSQAVTIGAPGVGGVPSVSGATVGATCSFGSLMTLPGGTIGVNVAVSAFSVGSGNSAAPSGSNLIVSMPGQGGGNASGTAGTSAFSGVSGNNPLGIGDISHVSAVGATGNGYGSGGGGAAQSGGANAARNGGNGAPGAFIVQEFA